MPRELVRALAAGEAVSGAQLAGALGVSRAAVWKHMDALREQGLPIMAARGRGYRLPWPLQLLDAQAINAFLGADAGAPVQVRWSVDSTQQALLGQAGHCPDLAALLAETQRSGRGRRGRTWLSPPACGVALSCVKHFERGFAALAGLSPAVGVAVVEALASLDIGGLKLKWPNDVVGPAGKLAGVLIDLKGEYDGPCHGIIGIGMNVRLGEVTRAGIDQAVMALDDLTSTPPDRNLVAARLLWHVRDALQRFEREGFAPFQETFARLDVLRGQRVQAAGLDGRRIEGIAAGVSARGAMRVQVGATVHEVTGGEVSLRPARS